MISDALLPRMEEAIQENGHFTIKELNKISTEIPKTILYEYVLMRVVHVLHDRAWEYKGIETKVQKKCFKFSPLSPTWTTKPVILRSRTILRKCNVVRRRVCEPIRVVRHTISITNDPQTENPNRCLVIIGMDEKGGGGPSSRDPPRAKDRNHFPLYCFSLGCH
ncbi:hypothetical protein NPIL_490871 [Nephila pilipes]|uniref:Uncharacterized protein n=1 Tax=Nephila pilipes TaxID=299642 RepID=A0A8X6PVP8_NEPPI|nr:hypothetical protein NPIL_490871 [Nephila pilipes]